MAVRVTSCARHTVSGPWLSCLQDRLFLAAGHTIWPCTDMSLFAFHPNGRAQMVLLKRVCWAVVSVALCTANPDCIHLVADASSLEAFKVQIGGAGNCCEGFD